MNLVRLKVTDQFNMNTDGSPNIFWLIYNPKFKKWNTQGLTTTDIIIIW